MVINPAKKINPFIARDIAELHKMYGPTLPLGFRKSIEEKVDGMIYFSTMTANNEKIP